MGTRNTAGKQKRKTRVGFRIPSPQNHNSERPDLALKNKAKKKKKKNMDLGHDMPTTVEHLD